MTKAAEEPRPVLLALHIGVSKVAKREGGDFDVDVGRAESDVAVRRWE